MTQTLSKFQQSNSRSSPQGLAIHRDSRVISKIQPKIRIIHIFAPEIIHTDVAHFSETVQRLTGKASSSPTTTTSAATTTTKKNIINVNANPNPSPSPRASKLPMKDDHHHLHDHDKYDHGHNHGFDHGSFLEALQGVNYNFMHEIGELSFVSMEAGNSHHHNHLSGFGDTHNSFSYRG